MWVYESSQQAGRNQQGKQSKDFLVLSFKILPIIFIGLLLIEKLGHWNRSYSSFIVSSIVSYVMLKNKNKIDAETVLCLKCNQSKIQDQKSLCKCGGKSECLYKLKWVKEKSKDHL